MNLADLDLFVRTADCGSITRAADQLNMSSAAASAAIKRLERQLAAQLFIRSTRQLRITAEGERFLVYCRKALQEMEAGKASINALEGKVAGEMRISMPSDLGRNMLLAWMDEIMDQHPDLSLNILLGDALSDFYMDRVDLAIRYGNLEDSSMVAFRLARIERLLCASPGYIANFGMPEKPEDLVQHNCLLFQLSSRINHIWQLVPEYSGDGSNRQTQKPVSVRVSGDRYANDGDVVRRWAIAGKGIAFKSRLDIAADLRAGRLVRLLPQYQSPKIDLNLISPTRAQISPAVLLLRDMLRDKFSAQLDL